MANITIDHSAVDRLRAKLLRLRLPIDRTTADNIGKGVIDEMKDMISKGISPIQGQTRFPAYKNPDKYPGNKKSARPVNLYLTGEFLKNLTYKIFKNGESYAVRVGFFDRQSQLIQDGHRVGVNKQPKRPIIPDKNKNESFAQRIQRIISGLLRERIAQIIK